MAAPIIGVCAAYERAKWSFWDMPAAIVASTYLSHISHEGAVPIALIPSEQTLKQAHTLVSRIDGLLLLGGADVDPSQYGEEPTAELEATVLERDRTEIALVRAALDQGIPILGVCRGLHILNVATGGTLMQDIGGLAPGRHRRSPGYLDDSTTHAIDIVPGSHIDGLFGSSPRVNSHHHQAVKTLGKGARVTAICPDDGVIEALEWDSSTFTVGVQWHPEAAEFGGVIAQFIDLCAKNAGDDQQHKAASAALFE